MAEMDGAVERDMAEQLAGFLNGLLEVDRGAVADLVGRRVPCNQRMAEHPFVQVFAEGPGGAEPFSAGILGILNGFLLSRAGQLAVVPPGMSELRLVVAEFGPTGELERFWAAPTATVINYAARRPSAAPPLMV